MIIIAPYAKPLRYRTTPNPKNYPWMKEVISKVKEDVIQIGVEGEEQLVPDFRRDLNLTELAELVKKCKTWISIDSFLQHFAWDLGKYGIAIFGQSDPRIFGHPENTNLLKDRKYLREKQFWLWDQTEYNADVFVKPDVVIAALKKFKVKTK